MNKRKLFTMLTAISLVGVIGVGVTLAYFTDTESAKNVLSMGHVDIEVTETETDGTSVELPDANADGLPDGLQFDYVMPAVTYPKDPTFTVAAGSEDCYIRVKFEVAETITAGQEPKLTEADLTALEDNIKDEIALDTDWVLGQDDYYYYQMKDTDGTTIIPMSVGDAATLFSQVTIPSTWGNTAAGAEFTITISGEAIQAANFTPEIVGGKYGWFDETDAAIPSTDIIAF